MPKIIILNNMTEQMFGLDLSSIHELYAAKSAWRNTWFACDGDIIVTPVPIKIDFLIYIGQILDINPDTITIVIPQMDDRAQLILTDELLLSADTVNKIRLHLGKFDDWTIMPCFYTVGVAQLAEILSISDHSGRQFAAQRGCDLLNRKTHFRQLAAGIHLPVADGSIAYTAKGLAMAIKKHIARTGTVIIKQDNSAGGMGNITITTGEVTPLPGSRETRKIQEDVDDMAIDLWSELIDQNTQGIRNFVVESYHEASIRFYLEYLIPEIGPPYFLNGGTIRLCSDTNPLAKELQWIGLEIPADIPSFSFANVLSYTMQLVMLAAQIGYRGYLNIDAIITDENELIFNEVNARWGGGTILHTIGERLLGKQYADRYVLSSLRDVACPPLRDVINILQENNLHFNFASKEGILIVGCDEILTNTMECLLIGSSTSRVRELEKQLIKSLGYADCPIQ